MWNQVGFLCYFGWTDEKRNESRHDIVAEGVFRPFCAADGGEGCGEGRVRVSCLARGFRRLCDDVIDRTPFFPVQLIFMDDI